MCFNWNKISSIISTCDDPNSGRANTSYHKKNMYKAQELLQLKFLGQHLIVTNGSPLQLLAKLALCNWKNLHHHYPYKQVSIGKTNINFDFFKNILIISQMKMVRVVSMQKYCHNSIGIPIIKIRRSHDHLIFIMGILNLKRLSLH